MSNRRESGPSMRPTGQHVDIYLYTYVCIYKVPEVNVRTLCDGVFRVCTGPEYGFRTPGAAREKETNHYTYNYIIYK